MKKIIAVILTLGMCLSLGGCGGKGDAPSLASSDSSLPSESDSSQSEVEIELESNEESKKEEIISTMSYWIPETWAVSNEKNTEDVISKLYIPGEEKQTMIQVYYSKSVFLQKEEKALQKVYEDLDVSGEFRCDEITVAGQPALKMEYVSNVASEGEESFLISEETYAFDLPKEGMVQITFSCSDFETEKDKFYKEFEELLSSITIAAPDVSEENTDSTQRPISHKYAEEALTMDTFTEGADITGFEELVDGKLQLTLTYNVVMTEGQEQEAADKFIKFCDSFAMYYEATKDFADPIYNSVMVWGNINGDPLKTVMFNFVDPELTGELTCLEPLVDFAGDYGSYFTRAYKNNSSIQRRDLGKIQDDIQQQIDDILD